LVIGEPSHHLVFTLLRENERGCCGNSQQPFCLIRENQWVPCAIALGFVCGFAALYYNPAKPCFLDKIFVEGG